MEKEKIKSFIFEFYSKNNRVPSIQEIKEALQYPTEVIIKNIRQLIGDGVLVFTGDNKYFINSQILSATNEKSFFTQSKKINKNLKFNINNITIIKFILFLISALAGILSIYYTYCWALLYNNKIISFFLSFTTLSFSIVCFEVMIYFLKEKTIIKTFFAGLLFLLWIITFLFSISTTIIFLYNKRITQIKEKNIEKLLVDVSSKQVNLKYEEKQYLLKTIENKQEEYNILRQNWINEGINYTNDTYRKLNKLEKELQELRKELKKVNDELAIQLEKQEKKNIILSVDTFYEWMSRIFSIKPDLLEFFISLFPAVFIDLIAPLGISIALFFLNEKQKRKENKK